MLLRAQENTKKSRERMVLISTRYGDMKIRLYNNTPLHRDNFIKLAEEGYFNGTLFHRVINGFMIQGGDPDSRDAAPDVMLGEGGPDYTIPPEFVPERFHKKGVIAAAREGDGVNPEKRSSGSQFYIVQGRTLTAEQLDLMEERHNSQKKALLFREFLKRPENKAYRERYEKLTAGGQKPEMMAEIKSFYDELAPMIEVEYEKMPKFHYNEEQRETYRTLGGTPHLDGEYTVFGEVVEGMEVIDKIAAVKTNPQLGNRPLEDIPMTVKVLQ
ncbi:MAG: peptidylprolyl isomerase [Flavobacteriales bacterium]